MPTTVPSSSSSLKRQAIFNRPGDNAGWLSSSSPCWSSRVVLIESGSSVRQMARTRLGGLDGQAAGKFRSIHRGQAIVLQQHRSALLNEIDLDDESPAGGGAEDLALQAGQGATADLHTHSRGQPL